MLVLDYENKIKIPQNDKNFYKIYESDKINFSLEIELNPYQNFNITNLFLIIKAYSCNLIYVPHMLMISVGEKNRSFIISNNNVDYFKSVNYYNFFEWFNKNIEKTWMYSKKDDVCSFIFTYPIEIFDRKDIKYLKPSFPWNSIIYLDIINKTENEQLKNELILEQKKKIHELENELRYYKSLIDKGK